MFLLLESVRSANHQNPESQILGMPKMENKLYSSFDYLYFFACACNTGLFKKFNVIFNVSFTRWVGRGTKTFLV